MAPATQKGNFSEASKILHHAAQKGSRVTIVAKHLHLPHKKELGSQANFRSVTENFSEASKRLHLPRKKEVGSQAIMGPGHEGTSRRHRKYCTCHTKRT